MDKTPDRLTISSEALGQLQRRKAILNVKPLKMYLANAFVERSRFHFDPNDTLYQQPQEPTIRLR